MMYEIECLIVLNVGMDLMSMYFKFIYIYIFNRS